MRCESPRGRKRNGETCTWRPGGRRRQDGGVEMNGGRRASVDPHPRRPPSGAGWRSSGASRPLSPSWHGKLLRPHGDVALSRLKHWFESRRERQGNHSLSVVGWRTSREFLANRLGRVVWHDLLRGDQSHSITSSASARSDGGTVRSRAFAVLVFIMSLKDVGCSTGMSAGMIPFKTLTTCAAAPRPVA